MNKERGAMMNWFRFAQSGFLVGVLLLAGCHQVSRKSDPLWMEDYVTSVDAPAPLANDAIHIMPLGLRLSDGRSLLKVDLLCSNVPASHDGSLIVDQIHGQFAAHAEDWIEIADPHGRPAPFAYPKPRAEPLFETRTYHPLDPLALSVKTSDRTCSAMMTITYKVSAWNSISREPYRVRLCASADRITKLTSIPVCIDHEWSELPIIWANIKCRETSWLYKNHGGDAF
jgi:hypothetical protein